MKPLNLFLYSTFTLLALSCKKGEPHHHLRSISIPDGIWSSHSGDNAAFEIDNDSIYYPEADKKLHFIINDSVMTVYDENGEISYKSKVVHVSEDSLIMMSAGTTDTLVFMRFER